VKDDHQKATGDDTIGTLCRISIEVRILKYLKISLSVGGSCHVITALAALFIGLVLVYTTGFVGVGGVVRLYGRGCHMLTRVGEPFSSSMTAIVCGSSRVMTVLLELAPFRYSVTFSISRGTELINEVDADASMWSLSMENLL